MKTGTKLSIAVVLSLLACPTLAQDTSVSVDPSLSLSAEASATPSVDASSAVPTTEGPLDAQITTDNSFASLTAAINANEAVDLSGVTDESKISIVLVSTLTGDATTEGAAFNAALTAQAEALNSLRTSATANMAISAKLAAEGHAVEDVVAIRTDASGNTLVYVDDRV